MALVQWRTIEVGIYASLARIHSIVFPCCRPLAPLSPSGTAASSWYREVRLGIETFGVLASLVGTLSLTLSHLPTFVTVHVVQWNITAFVALPAPCVCFSIATLCGVCL